MGHYLLKRLIGVFLSLFVILTLVFFAFHSVPGDPAQQIAGATSPTDVERIREYLGLNEPLGLQYLTYLGGLVKGDLGFSPIYQADVLSEISSRLPATLTLLLFSVGITIVVGIPAGIVAAVHHSSAIDVGIVAAVVVALSVPNFWLGMMMITIFSIRLGLLPTSGFLGATSLIMPSIAVAARLIAIVARMTRATTLEVLREDYVSVARAKGLSESKVMYKHVIRNSLIPTLTVLGLQTGYLLGGSIVVEVLFAWPGIGALLREAITMRDYNMIQGITIVFVLGFLLVNLITDTLYSALDPRLRYT
jgi:ABC-type dipeptide/oligopeptide/nickel transport system permease component